MSRKTELIRRNILNENDLIEIEVDDCQIIERPH
jgi:hypothetical protein